MPMEKPDAEISLQVADVIQLQTPVATQQVVMAMDVMEAGIVKVLLDARGTLLVVLVCRRRILVVLSNRVEMVDVMDEPMAQGRVGVKIDIKGKFLSFCFLN